MVNGSCAFQIEEMLSALQIEQELPACIFPLDDAEADEAGQEGDDLRAGKAGAADNLV